MYYSSFRIGSTIILLSISMVAPKLSAMDANFGGSIKTIAIYDSNASGIGVNIPANALFGTSTESDVKIDATLSQFKADFEQELSNGTVISSHFVMDFNEGNDSRMSPRLREAYLNWDLGLGQLKAGQTWSTFMDMRNYPLSLAEPTLSGVVFMRQPQLRWSQTIDNFQYDLALESGTNTDITNASEDELDTTSSLPEFIAAVEWADNSSWLRLSSAIGQSKARYANHSYKKVKYGIQASAGFTLSNGDQFTLLMNHGKGMDRYLLGISGTGATWNATSKRLDMRKTNSAMVSYTHNWQPTLKSVLAYGHSQSEPLSWQHSIENDTFTESNYGMVNLLWSLEDNLTLGLEYDYSHYKRSLKSDSDNHRLMLGIEWKY
ncbi:DcaP family trimeric outer membrane transporter [Vibrio owensii]|uniref:DcaP family trimeric outer membrane transporter n=1 Tax=Vibrio harveyi group TaxID=717610 RepID=UPI00215C8778|nr:DcaP family trimeric outer membrane transporter [Vibrio parahaemolyticus]MCR9663952.1 DcaP family trimeric outer membrane transporter [Vibrio parahaemolyticus]MCR9676520.1 DcaP family trimeric outer membrane transporter [Vibrio parahaemolyticus]